MPKQDDQVRRAEYADNLKDLLERGMDIEEAENFLVRGNRVHQVRLSLPPAKAEEALASLKKMAVIAGQIEVSFILSLNRYEQFTRVLEETTGQKIVHGDFEGRKPS